MPSFETREIARRCASVYQADPSASAARPSGSRLSVGLRAFSIRPSFNRPIAFEESMVNHTVPSRASAMATGISVACGILHSTNPDPAQGPKRHASAAARMPATMIATPTSRRRVPGRRVPSVLRAESTMLTARSVVLGASAAGGPDGVWIGAR